MAKAVGISVSLGEAHLEGARPGAAPRPPLQNLRRRNNDIAQLRHEVRVHRPAAMVKVRAWLDRH
jgi:hypothetical protein